ncbi:MAG: VIT family protein [Syntrophus sp. PtaB.Bin001]|nr:MAG: VIT family protein [Syntrophus sp. PtaB.Bin001]
MRWPDWLKQREHCLAVVMGLVDGILTAMLLGAGRMLGWGMPIDFKIALKVAVYALATAGFVFYIGRYAEFRAQLVHAAAQLNLKKGGQLATTHLGRMVLGEAVGEAIVSGGCSFMSALLPLSLAVVFPSAPWSSVILSLCLLGILGYALGRMVKGSSLKWAVGLVAGGVFMTILGSGLHIL